MALCHRRQFRLGCMVDVILVLVVLALLASFSSKHGQFSRSDADDDDFGVRDLVECLPSHNIRRMRELEGAKDRSALTDHHSKRGNARIGGNSTQSNSGVQIDQRLKVIKDSRPPLCRKLNYDTLEKVTLIVHFNDYQFNDLKNTMGSILLYTDMDLIEEILVIDDASSLDHIVQEAIKYFRRIPKARYLRHRENEPAGTARVRTIAAKEARANIVVFLDWWTICNHGWLEPLIDMLVKDPNAIAVPHFDKIHDPVSLDYVKSKEHQIATLSWNLAIRVQEGPGAVSANHGYHHTPAIRGNVFAVRKEFFFSIGAYDTDLDGDGGGEHAELSVRAWLCTGSVKVVSCSRVGLLNVYDPVKVSSTRNVRRIAEMWFGKRKSTVLRSSGLNEKITSVDIGSVSERRNSIPLINQCKEIDWYLTNIATNMVAPSSDAIRFGILRVKTDRCGRLLPAFDRIKLDDCKPEHFTQHRQEMLFELTKDGHLKVMGKCMTTKDNAYLLAEKCRPGDTKQQWRYIDEQLINVWCNFCAMHVTDPDSRMEGDRQIAMAQECNADTSNGGLFKKWEFLLP